MGHTWMVHMHEGGDTCGCIVGWASRPVHAGGLHGCRQFGACWVVGGHDCAYEVTQVCGQVSSLLVVHAAGGECGQTWSCM